ncbi:hypothetical protein [Salinicoccus roseus]|uniref:hypothetical protein n=1 Tax=Salinicoccus roseus TaxID=45670 RepID=UPI00356A47D0
MPSIPVICSYCSAVFSSPIFIENSDVTFKDVSTSCPSCRKDVKIPDGRYEERDNVLKVVDSGDDDFINNVIAIYTSNFNNEQKLTFLEKLFDEKRGADLEEVVGDEYKEWSTTRKLLFIWMFISGAREFRENIAFINEVIKFILSN